MFHTVMRQLSMLTMESRPPQKLSACHDFSLLQFMFPLQTTPTSSYFFRNWQTPNRAVGAIEQEGLHVKRLLGAQRIQQQISAPAHLISYKPSNAPGTAQI